MINVDDLHDTMDLLNAMAVALQRSADIHEAAVAALESIAETMKGIETTLDMIYGRLGDE